MNSQKRPILLMAGGTGGHVFPALAIAEALNAQGIPVCWLGTRQGLEARVVPETDIPIYYVSISGLRGKGLLRLLTAPFKIIFAIWQSILVLRTCRPALVIGMGGFVTGPGGVATWLLRIPLIIHEQNAIAGLTNQWLARLAHQVLEAFPHTFPPHYNALYTGNPVRASITALTSLEPKLPSEPFKILIIGGSLGAKALNEIIPQALQYVTAEIQVWHQTGPLHIDAMHQIYARKPFKARVEAFIENMAEAYHWADLVICRAGASTISELTYAGVPSILIPYPFAVDDHQTYNAHFLVEKGAAILLPQTELTADKLSMLINELIHDPSELQRMAERARRSATPAAVQQIVQLCLQTITD